MQTRDDLAIAGTVSELRSFPWGAIGAIRADVHGPPFNSTYVKFIGNADAVNGTERGQRVTAYGRYVDDAKYGPQLRVTAIRPDISVESGGLAAYIANHPDIVGIGPVKAKKLVDTYGNIDEILSKCGGDYGDGKAVVAAEIGVNPDAIKQLVEVLQEDRLLLEIKAWLTEANLTHKQCETLVERYGWQTKRILEENPYLLIRELPGYGFRRCDEIAQKLGVQKDNPHRIDAGILYAQRVEEEKGHTYTNATALGKKSKVILALDRDAVALFQQGMSRLILDNAIVVDDDRVSTKDSFDAERRITDTLSMASSMDAPMAPKEFIEGSDFGELNQGQHNALLMSFLSRVAVITGGAGTGKTFTIGAIVRAYESLGLTVRLAAFAGKAAQRIEEATGYKAQTIHRLLEYHPFNGWGVDKNNPLDADCVIIDEASMIGVNLFDQILQSIDLNRTTIIFVGDHNQLPPVEAGYPFRDIVNNRLAPTVELNVCVRQAGLLKQYSVDLLKEGVIHPTPTKSSESERFPWYVFTRDVYGSAIKRKESYQVHQLIEHLLEYVPDETRGLGISLNQIQFLTALNARGSLSARAINEVVQKWIHAKRGKPLPTDSIGQINVGDRVIQTKNDYNLSERGIFNGTLGVVTESIRSGSEWIVEFDGEAVKVAGDAKKNLQLAYCLTVHKAQGSEFPCVVTLCGTHNSFFVDRNWLYTAVTRASKCSIIVGDTGGIKMIVGKTDGEKRRTVLSTLA